MTGQGGHLQTLAAGELINLLQICPLNGEKMYH